MVGRSFASGQLVQESERASGATAVTLAVPARLPPVKRSTLTDLRSAASIGVESSEALSVYVGRMTAASSGVGPTTKSAGPADESQADTGGGGTTVLSGGGTTGMVVSFRPGTGSGRSHAAKSNAIRPTIARRTRHVGRGLK